MRRLLDVDGRGEDAEDLAPAGDGGLRLVEDLAQLGDRDEQEVDEEDEGDQLAEVQAPCRTVDGADRHHAGQAQRAEEVGQREHHREPLGRAHLGPVLRADGVVEAAARAALQAVGEHDRRAGHQLGHLREGAADGGAHLVVGGQLPPLEVAQGGEQREEHRDRRRARAATSRGASRRSW